MNTPQEDCPFEEFMKTADSFEENLDTLTTLGMFKDLNERFCHEDEED